MPRKKTSVTHEDVKAALFQADPALKTEYDQLQPFAEIAQEIYRVRTEAGLTQAELAQRIGTRQANIARIENLNYEGVSLTTLLKIADALQLRLKIAFEDVA